MRLDAILKRLDAYERLIRLDKPIGTLLLLWPTLWAVWIAGNGRPDVLIVWVFTLGTVIMRSPAARSTILRTSATTGM